MIVDNVSVLGEGFIPLAATIVLTILGVLVLTVGTLLVVAAGEDIQSKELSLFGRIAMGFCGVLLMFSGAMLLAGPHISNAVYADDREDFMTQLEDQGYTEIKFENQVMNAVKDGTDVRCLFADSGDGRNWVITCQELGEFQ